MEHGAWAAWKWVGKAEAGISEGSDANKAEADGDLEERPRVKPHSAHGRPLESQARRPDFGFWG